MSKPTREHPLILRPLNVQLDDPDGRRLQDNFDRIVEWTKPMYLKQRSTDLNYSGTNAVWKCRTWTLLGILTAPIDSRSPCPPDPHAS